MSRRRLYIKPLCTSAPIERQEICASSPHGAQGNIDDFDWDDDDEDEDGNPSGNIDDYLWNVKQHSVWDDEW